MFERFLRRKRTLMSEAEMPAPGHQTVFKYRDSGLSGGIYRVVYEVPELSWEVYVSTAFYLALFESIDGKTEMVMLEPQRLGLYLPQLQTRCQHSSPLAVVTPEEIAQVYPQIKTEPGILTRYLPTLWYLDRLDKMMNWWN